MLSLRFPWLWWSLGWLLVAGISVGSLVPGEWVGEVVTIGDKFVHAGSYSLLMIWFGGLYPRRRHWVIAVLLFALGFALDLAQSATASRVFDLADVAANGGGILVGFVLARYLFEGWCRRVETLLIS